MADDMISNDPFKNENPGPPVPPIPPVPPVPPMPQFDAQAGFGQASYPAPAYGQKPKRKVFKWLLISFLALFILCGLGIGGCTYFFVSETKPVFDVANNFYKAAKNGDSVEDLACEGRYTSDSISPAELDQTMAEAQDQYGEIQSYDFNSYTSTSGFEEIKGTVTRDDGNDVIEYKAVVTIKKEDGKYKVCGIRERDGIVK